MIARNSPTTQHMGIPPKMNDVTRDWRMPAAGMDLHTRGVLRFAAELTFAKS
jgi:hypothetical protein